MSKIIIKLILIALLSFITINNVYADEEEFDKEFIDEIEAYKSDISTFTSEFEY